MDYLFRLGENRIYNKAMNKKPRSGRGLWDVLDSNQ